jgi:hypothetical protein
VARKGRGGSTPLSRMKKPAGNQRVFFCCQQLLEASAPALGTKWVPICRRTCTVNLPSRSAWPLPSSGPDSIHPLKARPCPDGRYLTLATPLTRLQHHGLAPRTALLRMESATCRGRTSRPSNAPSRPGMPMTRTPFWPSSMSTSSGTLRSSRALRERQLPNRGHDGARTVWSEDRGEGWERLTNRP